jgi:hypothetical protein
MQSKRSFCNRFRRGFEQASSKYSVQFCRRNRWNMLSTLKKFPDKVDSSAVLHSIWGRTTLRGNVVEGFGVSWARRPEGALF